jgi:hypothetical protein
MESPGSALRGMIARLNPDLPGAEFRAFAVEKAAEIVDAYWREIGEINAMEDGRDRMGMACMTMSHLLGSVLTSTMAHFGDEDAVCSTMCALSIIIANCEEHMDADLIPPREVVDAAADTHWGQVL